MASGNVARILRGPGRLVVNPVTNFATGSFPYGGVAVGHVNQCRLQPLGTQFRVWYEALAEVGDILEGDNRWSFSCFLRGWDDDAIEMLMQDGYERGAASQHSSFSVPGDHRPGTSALSRAVRLAYVPDDIEHVPGLVLFQAVPDIEEGAELLWQRQAEIGIPLSFDCLRDDSGRILQIGMLHDIQVFA